MSSNTIATSQATYCVNHPQTETLLRCNRCGRPVCGKCVELTPVGYRCKDCLHQQREGYYNASALDYSLAAVIGLVVSGIAGFLMGLLGGFWLIAIFAGPIGGGIIAESMRAAVRRHRGQYLWLVGCAVVIVGGLIGLTGGLPLLLLQGRVPFGLLAPLAGRALFNLGFWIYAALAVSTVYARLRV